MDELLTLFSLVNHIVQLPSLFYTYATTRPNYDYRQLEFTNNSTTERYSNNVGASSILPFKADQRYYQF